jgi:DHA2 family multidrug resistance protein-like MFS transporter
MVPPALAMFVTIGLGPALARTLRPAYITAVGMAVSAAGYVVLTQVGSTGGLAVLVAGFATAMAGIGPECPWATTWSWARPRRSGRARRPRRWRPAASSASRPASPSWAASTG